MAKDTLIAMVESTLALALVTTAAGLAVAIPAVWCRNHFYDRLEVFESEMSNAARLRLPLQAAFSRRRRRQQLPRPSGRGFRWCPVVLVGRRY
jgi:biopolymer transport protein ExbB/TolQ